MSRENIRIFNFFLFLMTSIPALSCIIAAGFDHTVFTDQTNVWTFGNGRCGQLGHDDTETKFYPSKIEKVKMPNIIATAAGLRFTVLLDMEGNVWTFGDGSYGRLGHGDKENKLVPTKIQMEGMPPITNIAVSQTHTLLLDIHKKVWTFGYNDRGQLGHGDKQDKLVPTKIQMEGMPDIIAMAAGINHTVLLDKEGKVWTCGHYIDGLLGHADENPEDKLVPTKILMEDSVFITAVAAGNSHTVLLDNEGKVWTFGSGKMGALGHGNRVNRFVPTKIELKGLPYITHIAVGCYRTILLDEEGKVWTCGYARFSSLGHEDQEDKLFPTKIDMKGLPEITIIAAGTDHMVFLDWTGNLWTFGGNNFGELGHGTEVKKTQRPTLLKDIAPIRLPGRKIQMKSAANSVS